MAFAVPLNDHCLVMGSRHFLEVHEEVDFTPFEETIMELEKKGRHLIYISHQHKLIGLIGLRDHLRDDVTRTLQDLRDSGIRELVMISGDRAFKAQMLGDELQLDKVYAEATPASKSQIVEELRQSGRIVMFVGDGVNDAPGTDKSRRRCCNVQGGDRACPSGCRCCAIAR